MGRHNLQVAVVLSSSLLLALTILSLSSPSTAQTWQTSNLSKAGLPRTTLPVRLLNQTSVLLVGPAGHVFLALRGTAASPHPSPSLNRPSTHATNREFRHLGDAMERHGSHARGASASDQQDAHRALERALP